MYNKLILGRVRERERRGRIDDEYKRYDLKI